VTDVPQESPGGVGRFGRPGGADPAVGHPLSTVEPAQSTRDAGQPVGPLFYGPPGPYDTEAEAVGAIGQPAEGERPRQLNLARLQTAADRAGVRLGSYDTRVLRWLAEQDPAAVEVIAAMIDRAAGTNDDIYR
jgi:hypothetical protein